MTHNERLVTMMKDARHNIRNPAFWIKGSEQGRLSGMPDIPTFCSIGAISASVEQYFVGMSNRSFTAYKDELQQALLFGMRKIGINANENGIIEFNDNPDTEHSQVLKAFDIAIEHLEIRALMEGDA